MKFREKIVSFVERMLRVQSAAASDYSPKSVRIRRVGMADMAYGSDGDTFEAPEWDFQQITAAYSVSSYCRQALDKYIELMFKEGYTFTGANPDIVDYVRKRFQIMALATGTPTSQFFIEMAEDLVKYSNVFVAKARQTGNQGLQMGGVNLVGVSGNQPIAGYFLLNPTSMEILRDQHGTVIKYKQEVPGGNEPIEFNPEDIIHIYYKRDRGKAFGQPFVWPVLDDIRALREAEEHVLRLLYRHLFPLYQYKVGIAEPGYEADSEEIDAVRAQIESMPTDGGIVTPERHEIKVIGADGEALDAEAYLRYFEERVFTGLGVSATIMGRGDTANRSTAENMTSEMHDRIKAFQTVLSVFINEFIVQELLLEAGYDPLENSEEQVEYRFRELDTELKIKKENHAVYKYEHNTITEDEMRRELGLDPIDDRSKMFMNLVSIPLRQEGVPVSDDKSKDTDNKNKPENQHGKRSGPKTKKEMTEATEDDSILEGLSYSNYISNLMSDYESCFDDIVIVANKHYENEKSTYPNSTVEEVDIVLKALITLNLKETRKKCKKAFELGVSEALRKLNTSQPPELNIHAIGARLNEKHKKYFSKLSEEMSSRIKKAIESSEKPEAPVKIRGVFESLRYRLYFIASTELMRAYNLGYAYTAKGCGKEELMVVGDKKCDTCAEKNIISLLSPDLISQVPPFHTKCMCTLTVM